MGDVTADWESAFAGTSIHGVLLIGSDQQTYIDNLLATVKGYFGSSISESTRVQGASRPGTQAGHERESPDFVTRLFEI